MRVLMTSIGSLVGHEFLDALQERRKALEIIGLNSIVSSPQRDRCDRFYLVPETESKAYLECFYAILKDEQPNLILAGRDEDVLFLSQFCCRYSEWSTRIPTGPEPLVLAMQDKRLSTQFAHEHHLPWARTWWPDSGVSLAAFVSQVNWPILAKPFQGHASRGVYLLRSLAEVESLLEQHACILQEALGDWAVLPDAFPGAPLYYQVPERWQYNAQTVIGPDGDYASIFIDRTLMVLGRSELAQSVDNDALLQVAEFWVRALSDAGARGCLNLQLLPDQTGAFKVFEVNLRLAGGSHGRLLMGFDELGELFQRYIPDAQFPLAHQLPFPIGRVMKTLSAAWVPDRL